MNPYVVPVLVPIVLSGLGVVGSYYTARTTAQSAIDVASKSSNVEMTKLALNVLNDPTSNRGLKSWAISMLGTYTGVPITPQQADEIVAKIEPAPNTPFAAWTTVQDPAIQRVFTVLQKSGWEDALLKTPSK